MNTKYSITCLLFLLLSTVAFAQCPISINESSSNNYLQFDINTNDCDMYPATINVDGAVFKKVYCDGEFLEYSLDQGDDLQNVSTISVDMEFSMCDYLNGSLRDALSTPEIIFTDGLKIFPNPASRNDFVVLKFSDEVTVQITVVDLTGKIVLKDRLDDDNKIHLRVDTLTTGLYLINIVNDEDIAVTRKLVIH